MNGPLKVTWAPDTRRPLVATYIAGGSMIADHRVGFCAEMLGFSLHVGSLVLGDDWCVTVSKGGRILAQGREKTHSAGMRVAMHLAEQLSG